MSTQELRLRWLTGPHRHQEARFAVPTVRIGRSRDNDLVLPPSEPAFASGHHAEIRCERGVWRIIDCGSTNGTFLNGRRVERSALRTGDRLTIGIDSLEVVAARARPAWRSPALVSGTALGLVATALAIGILVLGRPPSLETTAAELAQSVYLVAIEAGGTRRVVGTAFAVDQRGWLATNAHVADELQRQGAVPGGRSTRAVAVLSDSGGRSRNVLEARLHPNWRAGLLQDDVALIRLAPGEAVDPVRLADDRALRRLRRGVSLAAFGFAAAGTDPWDPRGRLAVDVLGDLRAERYLEVGLHITPGTSGSPVFTPDGTVVAMVAAGDFVAIPGSSRRIPAASGANWAIAVSAVRELLATLP